MRTLATIVPACLALAPLPALAQAPARDDSITVTGTREAPSNWRVAETDHVVVLSDGKESELVRIAGNLERLHYLLSALLNRTEQADATIKLRVTLVGDDVEFAAMRLKNTRSSPGPYAQAFRNARYYDPREDGAVLASSRYDQNIELQRGSDLNGFLRSTQLVPDPVIPPGMAPQGQGVGAFDPIPYTGQAVQFTGPGDISIKINELSVTIPAENRIYAAYAQHYLLTYFPHAYPRWYVDGFGELFGTVAMKDDGEIEFGRPPRDYMRVLDNHLSYPAPKVLTGAYLVDKKAGERWTPYHAWVLTHMLFFNDTRRQQLRAYLAKIASGYPMAEAAEAFGDLGQLQKELAAYDNRKVPYVRVTFPAALAETPIVRRLTEGQAAFVKGQLELGPRVTVPPAGKADLAALRIAALRERDDWLERLRGDARRYKNNRDAQILLAEAECRSGHALECVAAADRALAIDPKSGDALAWKGAGQVGLALVASNRAARLKNARATIARANRNNPESPLPLILYYRSFADAGETPPDVAIEGLMKAADAVPAAPGPRLLLGEALAKRGATEAARRMLIPVAHGAYESPEAAEARALLATLSG
ncbi:MAG: hypothetical protein KF730_06110 [Sphingomonas sp.]|uniref:tetratricopeptide repeat protein n=1 Tax=Sphingomonas sp. TaxID=28214 RepID=UPI0025DD49AC|nr:hypothetical protein [Sphingomonas sp.]MBX3564137.1 hypothetical protein [Sphingomonas sp.]